MAKNSPPIAKNKKTVNPDNVSFIQTLPKTMFDQLDKMKADTGAFNVQQVIRNLLAAHLKRIS